MTKHYAERDLMEMDRAGDFYGNHVMAMTAEQLHSKSDIAAELGWRDMQIANLKEQLTATTNSLTNAQEALKSAGIEADTVQAGVMELVDKLRIKQNHIKLRDTYIVELEKRAEDAEAKLAELEKQEPIMLPGIFDAFSAQTEWQKGFKAGQAEYKDEILELGDLFTRPAPAIDLDAVRAEGAIAVRNALVVSDDGSDIYAIATEVIDQLRAGNAGKDGE